MRVRLRQLRADEAGFTLPELLTAMVVGLVVLMAAFMLIDHATSTSSAIADRQDAVQRGRAAMEHVTTALRSQVCLGEATEPITAGDENGVTFYANLSSNPDTAQERTLRYDLDEKQLIEEVREGSGDYPNLTFPPAATKTNVLLDSVVAMVEKGVTQPIFRFYAYDAGGAPGALKQLAVPLSAEDASQIVMVKVAFYARPDTPSPKDRDATSLQSDIYVRLADPTKPAEGPRCI